MKQTKHFDYKEYGGCMISGFAGRFGVEQPIKVAAAYSKQELTKVYAIKRGHVVVSCHYSREGADKKRAELLEAQKAFGGKMAEYPIVERYYELFKTKPEMQP